MTQLMLLLIGIAIAFPIQTAFAKTTVLEGSPGKPHRKIMTVEVSDTSGNPAAAKNKLEKKLIRKADRYKADAIADVQYFPEINEPSYLRGKKRYARGTLVEYTKYPQKEAVAK
jgi:hypothetical protein